MTSNTSSPSSKKMPVGFSNLLYWLVRRRSARSLTGSYGSAVRARALRSNFFSAIRVASPRTKGSLILAMRSRVTLGFNASMYSLANTLESNAFKPSSVIGAPPASWAESTPPPSTPQKASKRTPFFNNGEKIIFVK